MKRNRSTMALMGLVMAMLLQLSGAATDGVLQQQWSKQRANDWYAEQDWRVGCNFIPSTAINQLEMWQAETWDPKAIDRELLWASKLGMNSVRVSLHDQVWKSDAAGFKKRIDAFLAIAAKYEIKPVLVIFDDCSHSAPQMGKKGELESRVQNSAWLQSPGQNVVNDPAQWGQLERYVKDILKTFGKDPRILFWDLYNEPGSSGQESKSLPLLKETFKWARSVEPSQPLSVGVWNNDLKELNDFQLAASDIITFQCYGMAPALSAEIEQFKKHGRPLLCTEWLRRGHSEVASVLPVFKDENVACYNLGLVSGKAQTSSPLKGKERVAEPERWFHDLLRKDGTPHDTEEIALFRKLTGIAVRDESTAMPLIVAHRGVSKLAPENTLPAFELAWEQGADAIEGDFMLTKDGKIVCIHDRTAKRTTGVNLVVANSTLSQLSELDAGAWFGEEFTATPIPTLAEVLSTVPAGKKIYIEIKCGKEIIPALLEDMKQSGLSDDQIVVISFDQEMLKELKAALPNCKTSWLVSFTKRRRGKMPPTYSAVLETLAEIKANGLSASTDLVDGYFIGLLSENGIGHHVWTIDDGPTAKRFQKLGTQSVTTNVPEDIQLAYDISADE